MKPAAAIVAGLLLLLAPHAGAAAALFGSSFHSYEAGSRPSGVAAADLNADGDIDLVVADEGANSVSILLGNGACGSPM